VHELGIATEILRSACAELEPRGGGRLTRVGVRIGELEAVEPPLLQYAWQALTADGEHAGARLVVEWVPAVQSCPSCGDVRERQPGSWLRLCPHCERPLRVRGGRALELREVRFDSYPTPRASAALPESPSEVLQ